MNVASQLLKAFFLALLCFSLGGSMAQAASPQIESGTEDEMERLIEGVHLQEEAEDELLDDGLDDLLEGADNDGDGESTSFLRDWKGFAEVEFRFYFADRNQGRNDEDLRLNSEFEFNFQFTESTSAFFRPRLFVGFLDEDVREFEPKEAYVTIEGDGFDLRVGQFIENWGIVDTYNPIDILNRRDLRTDILDPDRLGELGIRLRLFWDGNETWGEPTLSLYALPVFRETPFPTQANRFNFNSPKLPFDDDRSFDPDGFDEGLYAIRFQASIFTSLLNADIQGAVARGPEKFPGFFLKRGNQPIGQGAYYGAWTFGAGMRAVPNEDTMGSFLAKITFKLEMIYKVPYTFNNSPLDEPDNYFSFVFGIDRVFNDLLREQDQLTLTLEYAREEGATDAVSQFRPFRNDLIVRLFWEANDFSRTSLEGRALFDLESDEILWEIIFKRQLRFIDEDLTLTIQVQGFEPARTGRSLYDIFPDNTSALIGLRWNF